MAFFVVEGRGRVVLEGVVLDGVVLEGVVLSGAGNAG